MIIATLFITVNYRHLHKQGRSQDFCSGGGEASNKIFSKVARILFRGCDIQQKFNKIIILNFKKFI